MTIIQATQEKNMSEQVKILMVDNLPLTNEEQTLGLLQSMSQDERDRLSFLLFVANMEESHCLKKQRDYFSEFNDVYLADVYSEGEVIGIVQSDINDLTKRRDEGSIERVFYLKRWVDKKFGQ
tara:strand:+ start:118 stop:486 length:369 start_codon:yes stop_codon:yes gene_type:complete